MEQRAANFGEIEIPRSYFEEQVESLELHKLHMFGGSSQNVFNAVASQDKQSGTQENTYNLEARTTSLVACQTTPKEI